MQNVASLISFKFDLNLDGFTWDGDNIFRRLADYAGANGVSLVGIINYETAKFLNGDNDFDFFVPFARGAPEVQDRSTHDDHVKNTESYLSGKTVDFTTREYFDECLQLGESGYEENTKVYMGTIFYIKA